ncbi:dedicator of cytokinesis protein 6-like [Gordionus sp. m RMFG-2023]|uniref:dedicator of cytokinesis protein 6-like n=1 Tax=Gordionus sp. m RMFG-2023 TaxID=3053472 RepID=UPI0031FDF4E0
MLSLFHKIYDPLDYEMFLNKHKKSIDHDVLCKIFKIPIDNITIIKIPRSNMQFKLNYSRIKNSNNYMKDLVQIYKKYERFNATYIIKMQQLYIIEIIDQLPVQIYEIDIKLSEVNEIVNSGTNFNKHINEEDIRSTSGDPLLLDILEQHHNLTLQDSQDKINESFRSQDRHKTLFDLYYHHMPGNTRGYSKFLYTPFEHFGYQLIFRCNNVSFNLEIEPIYCSAALYDLNCKKKISENFYFDINSENLNKLTTKTSRDGSNSPYNSYTNYSCIFEISHPSPDIYLVIRFEKILQQGEISEVMEPYLKNNLDEKTKDKIRSNTKENNELLGKYRMPFAWTAINLNSLILYNSGDYTTKNIRNINNNNNSSKHVSLERGLSLDRNHNNYLRIISSNFSLDKIQQSNHNSSPASSSRNSASNITFGGEADEIDCARSFELQSEFEYCPLCTCEQVRKYRHLATFKPFTITMDSVFRQESDKISDEELFKNLTDLKKSNSYNNQKHYGDPNSSINNSILFTVKKGVNKSIIPLNMKMEFTPAPVTLATIAGGTSEFIDKDNCFGKINNNYQVSSPNNSSPLFNSQMKRIIEFPSRPLCHPHHTYKNLLYVYPKRVNFSNFKSVTTSSRNIGIKVELLKCEGVKLNNVFASNNSLSSDDHPSNDFNGNLTDHYTTTVLYHNKNPDFYNEIKIVLPSEFSDDSDSYNNDDTHLLFTFFHVRCNLSPSSHSSSQVVPQECLGYSWLRLSDALNFNSGEDCCLPVCLDPTPPRHYPSIGPEVALPRVRWLDNHKPAFELRFEHKSTLRSKDARINKVVLDDKYNNSALRGAGARSGVEEIKEALLALAAVPAIDLAPFIYPLLNVILKWFVTPLINKDHCVSLTPIAFEALTNILHNLATCVYFMLNATDDEIGLKNISHKESVGTPDNPWSPLTGNDKCDLHHTTNRNITGCSFALDLLNCFLNNFSICQDNADYLENNIFLNSFSPQGDFKLESNIPTSHSNNAFGGPSYGTLGRKKSSNSKLSHTTNLECEHFLYYQTSKSKSISDPDLNNQMLVPEVNSPKKRLLHEECCLQFVVSSGRVKEKALSSAYFFFGLIFRSMAEYSNYVTSSFPTQNQRIEIDKIMNREDKVNKDVRSNIFSQPFLDDLVSLVNLVTVDVCTRSPLTSARDLNINLAYFVRDLLYLVEPGFVANLVKSYHRQIGLKIQTISDPSFLIGAKLDFLEILSEHEHFISLNLPFHVPWANELEKKVPPSTTSLLEKESFSTHISFFSNNKKIEPFNRHHGNEESAHDYKTENSTLDRMIPLEFKQQHYYIGLILMDLMSVLEIRYSHCHNKAILIMLKLLAAHDFDKRFHENLTNVMNGDNTYPMIGKGMGKLIKTRLASLYFPFLTIILNSISQLCDNFSHLPNDRTKTTKKTSNRNSLTIEGESQCSPLASIFFSDNSRHSMSDEILEQLFAGPKIALNEESTKHMLICFLWILKNVDKSLLKNWWSELTYIQLGQFLELLYLVIQSFEYKGQEIVRSHLIHNTENLKSRLEDAIIGTLNARSEMMARRKDSSCIPNSCINDHNVISTTPGQLELNLNPLLFNKVSCNSPNTTLLRWRKDTWRSSNISDGSMIINNTNIVNGCNMLNYGNLEYKTNSLYTSQKIILEKNLCAETALIVLDTMELFIQFLTHHEYNKTLIMGLIRIILKMFSCNQGVQVLENIFATQRSIVNKYSELLFEEETHTCRNLCSQLLTHACSSISAIRSQATGSLYHLMFKNYETGGNSFALVKTQITVCLSSLVGGGDSFDKRECSGLLYPSNLDSYLRRSLKTLLTYAEQDTHMRGTSFPRQVQALASTLASILTDTAKIIKYRTDPEMLLDCMHRVADGYRDSPDLRLAWLHNMAAEHSRRSAHSEAAQCLIHAAAAVNERLQAARDRFYLPSGASAYASISDNVIADESVTSIFDYNTSNSNGNESTATDSKYFSETGLVGLLEQAASSFSMAGEYELVNEVYKLVIPIRERYGDAKKLAGVHGKLHEIFNKIVLRNEEETSGIGNAGPKRVSVQYFGATYFRVGFYGARFGELDREEYIYKEPAVTKLSEITDRLLSFYGAKFGGSGFNQVDIVECIKDSNRVDISTLDPAKACLQITYVEPYFDVSEQLVRKTAFERCYNVRRFVYATPFTLDGRSHGRLQEQYKRKTILTTQRSFPYIKTRIKVVDRDQIVLTPIEVAIEDLEKKCKELREATRRQDAKILAMVLQGSLGPTVNMGPLQMAETFLTPVIKGLTRPTIHHNKLRVCFKLFMLCCKDALVRNKALCDIEQKDYQRQIEINYQQLSGQLSSIINNKITQKFV